jgi:peptidoglycan L-alanyl-D-glutamate endopeptidase CwlK
MASRSLADLAPPFRERAVDWLSECVHSGLDILITCTFRPFHEQADLYAIGRTVPGRRVTNAKPGQSAHNYGLALDFVPMINGKPEWSGKDPAWDKAIEIAIRHEMQSLANDPVFPEKSHLQEFGWKLIAEKIG